MSSGVRPNDSRVEGFGCIEPDSTSKEIGIWQNFRQAVSQSLVAITAFLRPSTLLNGSKTPTQAYDPQTTKQERISQIQTLLEGIIEGAGALAEHKARGKNLLRAASLGHLDELESLLTGYSQISGEYLGQAVREAAEKGHLQVLNRLLSGQVKIDQEFVGCAYTLAARNGHTGVISRLLESYPRIPGYSRDMAVLEAAVKGHSNVVRLLLKDNVKIDRDTHDTAVRKAAGKGHVGVIEVLFEIDSEISTKIRGLAVREAAEIGHLGVINLLLEGSAQISEEHRGYAVVEAARNGHLDALNRLLDGDARIPRYVRDQALSAAAGNGNLNIINRLLEDSAQISHQYRGNALIQAALNGHFSVMRCLMRDSNDHIITFEENIIESALNIRHLSRGIQLATLFSTIYQNVRSITPRFQNILFDRISTLEQQQQQTLRDMITMIPVQEEPTASLQDFIALPGTLYVPSWKDLESNPLGYLRAMVEMDFQRVCFSDGKAIDLGGLTKEFVNRLILGLNKKKFIVTHEILSQVLLPIAETEEQKEALTLFGRLLTDLHTRNSVRKDKIMIPRILDPNFFDAICKKENEKLNLIDCHTWLRNVWKNPQSSNSIQSVSSLLEGKNKSEQEILTLILDWKSSVILAFECIDRGIGPTLREAMRDQKGCLALGREFFGQEINAKLVLEKLEILPPAEQHLRQNFDLMIHWFKEWINQAHPNDLERFVFCVTANRSLGEGNIVLKPNFSNGNRGTALEIHTCFNSLDFPYLPGITKELFLDALNVALDSEDYNTG
ncbi:MAG: ankyrin repeat domain-containing protein [Chlamydiia bacterium]